MKLFTTCVMACLLLFAPHAATAEYRDILQEWGAVQVPEKPPVQAVSVDHSTTALLILDIEELTCNEERRPRCLETVPRIEALMRKARNAGMPVIYSLTTRGTRESILPPVTPRQIDPVVQSSVDKFFNTPLAAILDDMRIKAVIVTGTAAHGAVLHTATGAAQRGLQVILPVDALSASSLYIEQAAVWLLHTGPATSQRLILTRTADISVQ
ncbi:cysteine hydrolase [Desulfovibrio psychrotolerans]|uniref:Isochorismatase n=1 Tax=Desulfovibrio psychrotolerans TaxID=415242 RepID=A0A7J0BXT8_9BACT|nr:cysteine hydrolase [Desulfovibrio psychrotolerans]GFM37814.1 isochorismatase [Desulfovibrio psychrotolerans]